LAWLSRWFLFLVACLNTWSSENDWQICFKINGWGWPLQFLDVELYQDQGILHSRLFCKETDIHAYVLPSSCHPPSICKSIPRSIALRIFRICSDVNEFCRFWVLFRDRYFARRGYDKHHIDKIFRIVRRMNRKEQLLPKARTQRDPTDIPFLVPYGRGTKDVHKVLTDVASLSIARQMHSSRSWRFPQKLIFKVGQFRAAVSTFLFLTPGATGTWMSPLYEFSLPASQPHGSVPQYCVF